MTPVPPAETEIDESLVRALLRSQHPDLARLPVQWCASGWDNVTYRLGDELAVRLPRIAVAADLVRKEQHWLPVLAPDLPVAVPVPVRIGRPGEGYPWPWSIVPWIPGRSAEHGLPDVTEARRFGRFLRALHRPAPPDAPRTDWRGIPLASITTIPERLGRLEATGHEPDLDRPALLGLWSQACATERDVAEVLVHGDLHPKNLVVDGERLAAVLDWGDLTVGDPATDLAAAWMLFPVEAHAEVWSGHGGPSPATLVRARGWAVFFGVTLLEAGLAGDAPFERIGRATLARLARPPGAPA